MSSMFVQAEHCRTSLESARTLNTELTEQIEQYAQKLKDVSSLLSFLHIILFREQNRR